MNMDLIHGQKEEQKKPAGRILSGTLRTARVEFTGQWRGEMGSLVSFEHGGMTQYARVDRLESHRYTGLTGYIYYLEPLERPARNLIDIFDADDDMEDGVLFIGQDRSGYDVRVHVNPLFDHTLVCGMTRAGKTHFCIVLLEETIMQNMPALIIDSHGEFVNLAKKTDKWRHTKNVVVVEDLRIEDLIPMLQQKKTVVYNLLGLPKISKANRVGEILGQLKEAKEKDYARAENQEALLQIPPVLVILDEAEIYAPGKTTTWGIRGTSLSTVTDIAKEGAKFGIGLIVVPQRVTMLDIDVRSQCNSAAVFRNIDAGSKVAVQRLDYLTRTDIRNMSGFVKGTCLMAGSFVRRVRTVYVRNLMSEKVKKVDFEKMLGIESGPPPKPPQFKPKLGKNLEGDVIDEVSGEIIEDGLERLARDDELAFEHDEGDGVILRGSHLSEEEQKILNRLKKTDAKGDRLIG
uniref:Helicase HerA central domain-containing protein n=1 Tax=viral metagenome TaxID=1070528 RepID=A0A6M3M1G4_9ZZZZ